MVAPDMVGFGYSDRPEGRRVQPADLGRPDRRRDGRPRHREGPPGRQQLRRRDRAADRHPAPGPDRQARADGQHGRALRRSPRAWTRSGATRARSRTCARCWTTSPTRAMLVNEELAQVRYKASMEPGFQESFSSMFPAPRQRWVDAMTTAEEEIRKLAAPHPDRARPRGQGHPAANLAQAGANCIDNADLSVFSHCGHWSMIERTADFNRLVRDFFLASADQAGHHRRATSRAEMATKTRRRAAGRPATDLATRDPELLRGSTRPWC